MYLNGSKNVKHIYTKDLTDYDTGRLFAYLAERYASFCLKYTNFMNSRGL